MRGRRVAGITPAMHTVDVRGGGAIRVLEVEVVQDAEVVLVAGRDNDGMCSLF